MDRQARMKNVLLFNLPEFTANPPDDNASIHVILNYLGLQDQPTHISRLGLVPKAPNEPRPVKLCFANQNQLKPRLLYFLISNQTKIQQQMERLTIFVRSHRNSARSYVQSSTIAPSSQIK